MVKRRNDPMSVVCVSGSRQKTDAQHSGQTSLILTLDPAADSFPLQTGLNDLCDVWISDSVDLDQSHGSRRFVVRFRSGSSHFIVPVHGANDCGTP
jgi:hypothetical protein